MLFLALLMALSITDAMAKRNNLKPTDFEPLTSLPWKKEGAKLEGVLDAIFREPNVAIRYPVLAEYLRMMPAGQLGKAFELCIDLNGAQTPDELIQFFLPIWAERDPKACWKRTKELLRLVGIEDGWLGHDSWKDTARITVQDINAIRASRFWIEDRNSLNSFPIGVDRSSLPQKERIRLMKEFTDVWLNEFGSWTGYKPVLSKPYSFWSHRRRLIHYFGEQPDSENMRRVIPNIVGYYVEDEAEFEVSVRRWLQAEPSAAPEILKVVQAKKWPPEQGKVEPRAAGPSAELMMIWAKVDFPAIVRWADGLDVQKDEVAVKARGLLMSSVDAATRDRWLANVEQDERSQNSLFSEWAGWNPKAALDAAAAGQRGYLILEAAIGAAKGIGSCCNTRSFGLGVVKEFDVGNFPKEIREEFIYSWDEVLMYWGDMDIGETARYGLDFLLRTGYAPREGLIKFFSGYDEYPGEDGMIDRTFCALRVWAVVKPREMKAWIATLNDAEMRKALTWLLQHPWGTGPTE
jgi:hypothetical protein